MKTLVLTLVSCLMVSPVFGADRHDVCRSWKDIQKSQQWVRLTNEQWQFVRGVFSVHPDTPFGLPPGDRAYMTQTLSEGNRGLVFVDGDNACDLIILKEPMVKIVLQVGQSEIYHIGKGM